MKHNIITAITAAVFALFTIGAYANGAQGFTGSLGTLGAVSLSGSAAGVSGGAASHGSGYGYVNTGSQADSTSGFHSTLDATHMNVDGYTSSDGAGMTEVKTLGNGVAAGNFTAGGVGFEANGALGFVGGYQPTGGNDHDGCCGH